MKLANVKNQEYTKEMFKDIAFFTLAEPGAMGDGNLMEFIQPKVRSSRFSFLKKCHIQRSRSIFLR